MGGKGAGVTDFGSPGYVVVNLLARSKDCKKGKEKEKLMGSKRNERLIRHAANNGLPSPCVRSPCLAPGEQDCHVVQDGAGVVRGLQYCFQESSISPAAVRRFRPTLVEGSSLSPYGCR